MTTAVGTAVGPYLMEPNHVSVWQKHEELAATARRNWRSRSTSVERCGTLLGMAARFTELVIDARDPESVASFWMSVLGWEHAGTDDDGVQIRDPSGQSPTILFACVPENKTTKNRLHIDVNPVGCDQEDELARLLALGAHPVDVGQGEPSWIVLADPEGNEFCLLRTRRD